MGGFATKSQIEEIVQNVAEQLKAIPVSDLSYAKVLDNEERTALNTPFPLAYPIYSFDFILVQNHYTAGDGNSYASSSLLYTGNLKADDHEDFNLTFVLDGGRNDRFVVVQIVDATHYQIIDSAGKDAVKGVFGIKLLCGNVEESSSDLNYSLVEEEVGHWIDGKIVYQIVSPTEIDTSSFDEVIINRELLTGAHFYQYTK